MEYDKDLVSMYAHALIHTFTLPCGAVQKPRVSAHNIIVPPPPITDFIRVILLITYSVSISFFSFQNRVQRRNKNARQCGTSTPKGNTD